MHKASDATLALLETFSAAWNNHDISGLMACMHDDCVFETAAGPEACGTRIRGRDAVAAAFESAWLNVPDAQWTQARHWAINDRGVSEWKFVGTAPDGSHIEANGVDLFTFKDGLIAVKNVFRKDRKPLPV